MAKSIKPKLGFSAAKVEKKYDPSVSYTWSPDIELTLTGKEFEIIFNTLNEEIHNPSGASIAAKVATHGILQNIFERGVENYLIVEAK